MLSTNIPTSSHKYEKNLNFLQTTVKRLEGTKHNGIVVIDIRDAIYVMIDDILKKST